MMVNATSVPENVQKMRRWGTVGKKKWTRYCDSCSSSPHMWHLLL